MIRFRIAALALAAALAVATPAAAQDELFANNAESTVAGGLGPGTTTITVSSGTGSRFPTPTGGDYFWATLSIAASSRL